MTYDESKGLTITYHMLNLPDSISINSQNGLKQSRYIYDADGDKLANIRNGDSTVYYIDGIQYGPFLGVRSYLPAFVQTEEGRMFPYSTDTSAYYQYYFTDHLGNTRVTFDSHTATATKVQQDDYLPFGMEINRSLAGSPKNEYLYNRKELQENTQLYDYEHRFYDPVLGRFTTIDRLAEATEQIDLSPFAYVGNNPIDKTDPHGDCPMCVVWAIVEGIEALTATEVATATVAVVSTAGTLGIISHAHSSSNIPTMQQDATSHTTAIPERPAIVQSNSNQKDIGTIYRVPGSATRSGKPYIGRHNKTTPQKTRKSNDGRDRKQAEVIDTYDTNNALEGRNKEQQAIDDHGGVDNLDNKRNEVKKDPTPGSDPSKKDASKKDPTKTNIPNNGN